MEEEYWRRFLKTGKIKDYLYYRGMAICDKVMNSYIGYESYESGGSSESDYSDRHGACGGACRRV
ncbi:MAG: hypothetical protein HFG89_04985 [Dorea sp.]|nr:hypothetical protein [Dorea sp.]